MARKTIYCAQAFWPRRGRLKGGEVHQFLNRERALEGGRALATGAPGVAVFSVDGYPDIDLWDEPRMLHAFGEVPAIDPDPPPGDSDHLQGCDFRTSGSLAAHMDGNHHPCCGTPKESCPTERGFRRSYG